MWLIFTDIYFQIVEGNAGSYKKWVKKTLTKLFLQKERQKENLDLYLFSQQKNIKLNKVGFRGI